jgi:hypothetical protein
MYLPNLIQIIIPLLIIFIASIIFSIFSPLGIGFIIFSIIRWKTENDGLRKTSLVFQIILTSLTFLIGFLISLLFVFLGSPFYIFGLQSWIFVIALLSGISFISAVYIGVIIWESKSLFKK